MLILGLITLYFVIGVAVGRILFIKTIDDSARWTIGEVSQPHSYDYRSPKEGLVATEKSTSASNFGLWSIAFWPLTLSVWLVLSPTPVEKAKDKAEQLEEEQIKSQILAKKYGLKTGGPV